jgi:hypothetical protein
MKNIKLNKKNNTSVKVYKSFFDLNRDINSFFCSINENATINLIDIDCASLSVEYKNLISLPQQIQLSLS